MCVHTYTEKNTCRDMKNMERERYIEKTKIQMEGEPQ